MNTRITECCGGVVVIILDQQIIDLGSIMLQNLLFKFDPFGIKKCLNPPGEVGHSLVSTHKVMQTGNTKQVAKFVQPEIETRSSDCRFVDSPFLFLFVNG